MRPVTSDHRSAETAKTQIQSAAPSAKTAAPRGSLPTSDPGAWLKAAADAAAQRAAPDRNSAKDPATGRPLERTHPHGDAESPAIRGRDVNGSEGELVYGDGDQSGTDHGIEATSVSSASHSFPLATRDDGSASASGEGPVSIPSSGVPQAGGRRERRATDRVEKKLAPPSASGTAIPQDHHAEGRARDADNEHEAPAGKSPEDGRVRQGARRAVHGGSLSKAKGESRSDNGVFATRNGATPTPHAPAASSGQRPTAPAIPMTSPHVATGAAFASAPGAISAQQNDGITWPGSPDGSGRVVAAQSGTGPASTMASSPATVAGVSAGPDGETGSAGQPDQPSLRRAATDLAGMGGGSVSVTLRPPTLGFVRLQMAVGPTGATHIQLTAATQSGYAALTAAAPALAQHLANAGVAIGSLRTAMQGGSGHGQPQQDHRQRGGAPLEREHSKDDRDDQVLGYA